MALICGEVPPVTKLGGDYKIVVKDGKTFVERDEKAVDAKLDVSARIAKRAKANKPRPHPRARAIADLRRK